VIRDWKSRWYADGEKYVDLLNEDMAIREFVAKRVQRAGVSRIEIERFPKQVKLTIFTARPGVVIGRGGSSVKALRSDLAGMTGKRVDIDVKEIEHPEMDSKLVAENVASQLERRISPNRAMKRTIQSSMRAGALGIKIRCKGRLHGSEMARVQWQREGRVPLHTLRADIDYALVEANTSYGRIGVKVWIYKGDILPSQSEGAAAEESVFV